MPANAAMEAAQALAATPSLVHAMRRQPLPDGIPALLKLLASEPDVSPEAPDAFGARDAQHLRAVAEAYVQRVMLYSGASPHRVMGVPPSASRAEMRANLRWLMTWLHPDKNPAEWRSAFASRVLDAWRIVASLETGARQDSGSGGFGAVQIMPAQPDAPERPFSAPPPWVRETVPARKRPHRPERKRRRRAGARWLWPRTRPRRIAVMLLFFALIIPGAYLFASESAPVAMLRDASPTP